MNIFTESKQTHEPTVRFGSEEWTRQTSNSIALTGTATSNIKVVLAQHHNILDSSSSLPRIKRNLVKKFQLILSQPDEIGSNNGQYIRCSICNEIIHWPAWYHLIRYASNHFACFICFDSSSPLQPSTKCYRRD